MAETKTEGLIYKGHPLRRIDNLIYYGTMADKYIVMMQILESKKENGLDMATKVSLQLQLTDPNVKARDRVVKKSEKEQPVRGDGFCLHLAGTGAGRQSKNPLTLARMIRRKGSVSMKHFDEKGRKGRCFCCAHHLGAHRLRLCRGRDGHRRRLHHRYFPAYAVRAQHLLQPLSPR